MEHTKALIVGLDGITWDVIQPLLEQGRLPQMQWIIQNGVSGVLNSVLHPLSPQAWASFETGVNPGKHGVYDFEELNLGPFAPISANTLRYKPFWRYLSDEQERNVIAINLLTSYPPQPVRGVVVSGRMTPPGVAYTYPTALQQELKAHVGNYIIDVDPSQALDLRDLCEEDFLNKTLEMIQKRTKAASYILSHHTWDVAIVIYTGPDVIQHFYWKYWDRTHPLYDADKAVHLQDAIPLVYEACDHGLAQLVKSVDDDVTIVVLSDHGFGPTLQQVNLTSWLRQEGFLGGNEGFSRQDFPQKLIAQSKKWARDVLPHRFYSALKRKSPDAFRSQRIPKYQTLGIDWQQTKAYALGKMGNIFINVQNREPMGNVAPGSDYEAIRDTIIERLQQWENPPACELS